MKLPVIKWGDKSIRLWPRKREEGPTDPKLTAHYFGRQVLCQSGLTPDCKNHAGRIIVQDRLFPTDKEYKDADEVVCMILESYHTRGVDTDNPKPEYVIINHEYENVLCQVHKKDAGGEYKCAGMTVRFDRHMNKGEVRFE